MANADGTLNMQDSINAADLWAGADAYGGYDNGHWADFLAVAQRFPGAHLEDFTVFFANTGKAGDFEPGDMAASAAVPWVNLRHSHGVSTPVLYASIHGEMPAIVGNLNGAGIPRSSYKLLSAHYGAGAHICGPHTCGSPIQCDGTQYADRGPQGQNVDLSLLAADFFGGTVTETVFTPPPNQPLSANGTDQMLPGQMLMPGQFMFWGGTTWVLANQTDGNVVLYDDKNIVRWQTNTQGKVGIFTMQTDGNLVHYGPAGAVWQSGTSGHPGAKMELQPADGNIVVYGTDGRPLWSSGT
jgi:hypothetical protein